MPEILFDRKRPKRRSPSYPAYDLETILQRAKTLREIAGHHRAPVSSVLQAWGYSLKSSNGGLTLAALKKFGLAEDEGKSDSRQLFLTALGHELAFYDSDRTSEGWKTRAQKAALTPSIHRDLWTKYGGELPDDGVIKPYLVLKLGFNDTAADELLREFRRTLSFVQLSDAARYALVSEDMSDKDQQSDKMTSQSGPVAVEQPPTAQSDAGAAATIRTAAVAPAAKSRSILVPYSPGEWASIEAAFPMNETSWNQMLAVLQAMKPGLVVSD